MPQYKEKYSLLIIYVGSQHAAIKDGMMRFPKKYNLNRIYVGDLKIAHLRIFPYSFKKYKIEVVYKVENQGKKETGYIAGIDLGLNNLATVVVNNENIRPLIINGNPLKALNLDFNNKKSKIQSKLKKLIKKTCHNKIKLFYQYKGMKFYVDMSKYKNYIDVYMHNNRDLELPEYLELYSSSINMNGLKKILNLKIITL